MATVLAADMALSRPATRPLAIARWLLVVASLVFLMVVVGGITRLTESGLSMVRWEPISGIVPPLSEAEWQAEFAAYKAYPEYQKVNRGMSLAEFKAIFFWEYLHRVMGRLIGLAFALPLAWFWLKRAIPEGYKPRLLMLLALGGMQGAIGWWMVASGLVDRPDVAHERLAIHLLTALVILAALVWTALDMRSIGGRGAPAIAVSRGWVVPFAVLLFVQILFGAFVAGLNAGYAFNTWPLMGEHWVPPGLASIEPLWRNLLDNPIAVQFVHRTLAFLVAAAAILIGLRLRRAGARLEGMALIHMVVLQFALGVATILGGVPIALGVAHQAGAAALVAVTAWAAHRSWARA